MRTRPNTTVGECESCLKVRLLHRVKLPPSNIHIFSSMGELVFNVCDDCDLSETTEGEAPHAHDHRTTAHVVGASD